jgi:hypothetical protein
MKFIVIAMLMLATPPAANVVPLDETFFERSLKERELVPLEPEGFMFRPKSDYFGKGGTTQSLKTIHVVQDRIQSMEIRSACCLALRLRSVGI